MELGTIELGGLVLAAFAAGWVDAIAGGGGLITVPALLATGLPVELALGTNKGQSVFGSGTALWRYARSGLVDFERAPREFLYGGAGALVGAALVMSLEPALLKPLVLVLLVAAALFLAFRPTPRERKNAPPPELVRLIGALLAFAIGAYDGFFGPGTGTFLILGQVLLLGRPFAAASANAKVVNFASNLASVLLFGVQGAILWSLALPMAGAQFAGSLLGVRSTLRVGDGLVRRVLLVVSLALVLKLGWELLAL